MHRVYFFLFALLVCFYGHAQKIETVYLNGGDSSSNYYIVFQPSNTPLKGYMFLIPGMFQKAEEVVRQTDLPAVAARNGILTIIPVFKPGISSFGIDTATQASFLEFLKHVSAKYKTNGLPFYAGGFSIGGTCAVKYAQLALRNNYPVRPAAVFAIDSPLDFERMYNVSKKELRSPGTDKNLAAENMYMLKRYEKEFGGAPASNLHSYYRISPYSFNDTMQYAIRPLVDLPIRFYTEPDIHWNLESGVDYSGMNAFDLAAMVNDLKRLGNKKVELVTTTNKGYWKPDNRRMPHSWSIADPEGLVQWLMRVK